MDGSKIAVVGGHALFAAELFFEPKRLKHHLLGLVEIAAGLMDHSEIAVSHRHTLFATQFFIERERLAMRLLSLIEIAEPKLQLSKVAPSLRLEGIKRYSLFVY